MKKSIFVILILLAAVLSFAIRSNASYKNHFETFKISVYVNDKLLKPVGSCPSVHYHLDHNGQKVTVNHKNPVTGQALVFASGNLIQEDDARLVVARVVLPNGDDQTKSFTVGPDHGRDVDFCFYVAKDTNAIIVRNYVAGTDSPIEAKIKLVFKDKRTGKVVTQEEMDYYSTGKSFSHILRDVEYGLVGEPRDDKTWFGATSGSIIFDSDFQNRTINLFYRKKQAPPEELKKYGQEPSQNQNSPAQPIAP
jgi:hypothetical protein